MKIPENECHLRKSLIVLGGKWNLIIIKTIGKKEMRFGEIKREIPDASEKMIIEKLKLLCEYNLIIRKDFKEVPPKVSYKLSKKGLEAIKVVDVMEHFSEKVLS